MTNRAIIFAATGEDYIRMAINSAESIYNSGNDIDTVLYTDSNINKEIFSSVKNISANNSRDLRISALIESEYDECLHMDVDTYVYEDITHLFECLDRFDMGITQDPIRNTHRVPTLPKCFPEYNGGIILFQNNSRVNTLFKDWLHNYEKMDYQADQPAFRKSIYENTEVKYVTLPREYNCRPKHPGFLSRNENAKIIHGRKIPGGGLWPLTHTADLSEVAELLNSSQKERVHYKRMGYFTSRIDIKENKRSYLAEVSGSLRRNGVVETLQKIYERISF